MTGPVGHHKPAGDAFGMTVVVLVFPRPLPDR